MSPTMTEGGIASWKKQAGETFSAGDVLLEIVGYLAYGTSLINVVLGNRQGYNRRRSSG